MQYKQQAFDWLGLLISLACLALALLIAGRLGWLATASSLG